MRFPDRRARLRAATFSLLPADRCQGCHWNEATTVYHDAEGRRWLLCPECVTANRAADAVKLEEKRRAEAARARERAGQARLL